MNSQSSENKKKSTYSVLMSEYEWKVNDDDILDYQTNKISKLPAIANQGDFW